MDDNLKTAVQRMKDGEEKGFNEVYSATYNRVYFRAKQIMKREEDAQDLTQIVFVEAYKNIHSLQAAEALYSWLDGITYNQGMKIYRKQRDVLLTEEAEGMFDVIENNDISSMPELTADQKATADIIKGIIEELPELQRTVVVAYYFDGLKVEQIAEMMECSANTIKSRLNYARKYIKERVEEKEKKEGYRLHVFGLPVLWFSIRMLAEKTTLSTQTAQNIYNGACATVGLEASTLALAGGGTAAGTASAGAAGAGTASAGAVGAGTASAGAATAATVAGETAKAAGLGAKFASLATSVKMLIIAGAVAVVGLGTAGIVTLTNNSSEKAFTENVETSYADSLTLEDDLSEFLSMFISGQRNRTIYATKVSDTEYCFYAEDIEKEFKENEQVYIQSLLPDHLMCAYVYYSNNNSDIYAEENAASKAKVLNEYTNMGYTVAAGEDILVILDYAENVITGSEMQGETSEQIPEQVDFELNYSAEMQISSFVAAAYQSDYSSVNRDYGWKIFSMTPDECLCFIKDYIDMVSYHWEFNSAPNERELPFNWINYQVTEQEISDFCKYGLGIEIPDDYTYYLESDDGSVKIENGELLSTFDVKELQIVSGNAQVVSQDENGISVSGSCYWYDPFRRVFQYTVHGVPSGNRDIFGGMTITDIEIVEEGADKVDYRLMARECVNVMNDLAAQGLYSDLDGYYIYDMDKDDIQDLILCKGTCSADYEYVIYGFDGTGLSEIGSTVWGTALYGHPTEKALNIQYIQMDYEWIFFYDMKTTEKLGENKLKSDGSGGYIFPMSTYQLTWFSETDEESIFQNIMTVAGY